MRSRTESSSLRASSGSRSASNSIEPLRSAKRTVTCLRSPSIATLEVRIFSAMCLGVYASGLAKRPAGSVVSAAPQDRQNFLPVVMGAPQLGQVASSRAPQSSQKRPPASFSVWQRGHLIREPPNSPPKVGTFPYGAAVCQNSSRHNGYRKSVCPTWAYTSRPAGHLFGKNGGLGRD